MPRTILCTSGTTIARDCPTLREAGQAGHPWDTPLPELSAQIEERLQSFDLKNAQAPSPLSAEFNSLLLLECSADDEVVLLAGDDAVGNTCSAHLAAVISKRFGIVADRCKVIRIPQLHVHDPERFKREGLPHLFEVVLEYLRDPQRRYEGGVIINPTGGFKGVVPFLTLLGMLYGARVAYGSRASGQLISLPPVPVVFDPEVFSRAREAMSWAERTGVFQAEQFFSKISDFQPGDEEQFSVFIEITPDGDATLSPLAQLLVQKNRDESGRVFLSSIVTKKLRGMRGTPRSAALAWLQRAGLARWREGNGHAYHGTDLEVYGDGHKPIRVAGFCNGRDFHVCQFYFDDHNTYDRELSRYQRAQFQDPGEFVALHEDSFGPEEASESWADLLT